MKRAAWVASFFLLVSLASCTAGDASAPGEGDPTTHSSLPTPLMTILRATQPEPLVKPSTTPDLPSLTPTDTQNSPTALPTPLATMGTPAEFTLPEGLECATPKSLMLHSAYGAKRMRDLADVIIEKGWKTSTYRQVLDHLQQGQCPPEDTLIVSLDDLGTSWLRPDFIDMVDVFIEKGLRLVVGVVVHGPQDPEIWNRLKEWDRLGIEVASHTLDHYILTVLSDEALTEQVSVSYEIICENLGKCPITLILTFGEGGADERIRSAAEEYFFLVGIQGGREFSGSPPYYLGRIPPDNNAQSITINLLENSFGLP